MLEVVIPAGSFVLGVVLFVAMWLGRRREAPPRVAHMESRRSRRP